MINLIVNGETVVSYPNIPTKGLLKEIIDDMRGEFEVSGVIPQVVIEGEE